MDPRIRRTRKLLQDALDKLLQTKDFNELSVQDIADEAGVNRATFYDHYSDKNELLNSMVGCRFHRLLAEREIQYQGSCRSELQAIVRAVCDYLTQRRELEPPLESAVIAAVRGIFLAGIKQHASEITVAPEIVAASVSWAIYGAAKEWAQAPDRCSPEEISERVTSLLSPVLQVPH